MLGSWREMGERQPIRWTVVSNSEVRNVSVMVKDGRETPDKVVSGQ